MLWCYDDMICFWPTAAFNSDRHLGLDACSMAESHIVMSAWWVEISCGYCPGKGSKRESYPLKILGCLFFIFPLTLFNGLWAAGQRVWMCTWIWRAQTRDQRQCCNRPLSILKRSQTEICESSGSIIWSHTEAGAVQQNRYLYRALHSLIADGWLWHV